MRGSAFIRVCSIERYERYIEHEARVRRNRRGTSLLAVAKLRRDAKLSLPTDLHPDEPLVPTLDHFPLAERHLERGTPVVVRAVELLPTQQSARVLNAHGVPRLGGAATSNDPIFDFQLRRWRRQRLARCGFEVARGLFRSPRAIRSTERGREEQCVPNSHRESRAPISA